MCQCGCGEFPITEAYKLPKGEVLGIGFYRGCEDCFAGPGVAVYVFPSRRAGKEWLRDVKVEDYKPDEFGGNGGRGISLSFFEVQDLREAIKTMEPMYKNSEFGDQTLDEWLEENGLEMMQKAMKIFTDRVEKLRS